MTVPLLYLLASLSLLVGTSAVSMALIEAFPIRRLYYHRVFGKPSVWTILIGSTGGSVRAAERTGAFQIAAEVPRLLLGGDVASR